MKSTSIIDSEELIKINMRFASVLLTKVRSFKMVNYPQRWVITNKGVILTEHNIVYGTKVLYV